MTIKAIQTVYAGHKFRSRLEARWAVFFDALGIEWQYEPEGFSVGGASQWSYLPDFYLPESKLWVEVKGDWASCSGDYFEMLYWLAEGGSPLPHMSESNNSGEGGLLLLGPIPRDCLNEPCFTLLTNHKGMCIDLCSFSNSGTIHRHNVQYYLGDDIKKQTVKQQYWIGDYNPARAKYTKARQARFEFGETPVR